MPRETYWAPGQWNVVCPRCGFRQKSAAIRKEWTGQLVCKRCYEERHPLDMIRGRAERIAVPWTYREGGEAGA